MKGKKTNNNVGRILVGLLVLFLGVQSAFSCRIRIRTLPITVPKNYNRPPTGVPTINPCRSFSPPARHG
ncbi:unnamed protein product [Linum tenue]|uniref:Uncharacterized protein n=1 Tax=Linum tenue TaxID=586396 RepID=A0AAV0NKT8_9ROSI|nr:unnamed protein product [Linum tenue]